MSDKRDGRGGGLLVYSKQGLKVQPGDMSNGFVQYCKFDVYGMTLYLVYRPPNSSQQNMDRLAELVGNAKESKTTKLILLDSLLQEIFILKCKKWLHGGPEAK
jgi:hypothetical protein